MMHPAGRLTQASEPSDVAQTDADIRANCEAASPESYLRLYLIESS